MKLTRQEMGNKLRKELLEKPKSFKYDLGSLQVFSFRTYSWRKELHCLGCGQRIDSWFIEELRHIPLCDNCRIGESNLMLGENHPIPPDKKIIRKVYKVKKKNQLLVSIPNDNVCKIIEADYVEIKKVI